MDHAASRHAFDLATGKESGCSGALGDLGAHIIAPDRFLVGEIKSVSAKTRTFIRERPTTDGKGIGRVDMDEVFCGGDQC